MDCSRQSLVLGSFSSLESRVSFYFFHFCFLKDILWHFSFFLSFTTSLSVELSYSYSSHFRSACVALPGMGLRLSPDALNACSVFFLAVLFSVMSNLQEVLLRVLRLDWYFCVFWSCLKVLPLTPAWAFLLTLSLCMISYVK